MTFQFSNDLYAIQYTFHKRNLLKYWFHKHLEIRHDRLRLRRFFVHTQNIMQINFSPPEKNPLVSHRQQKYLKETSSRAECFYLLFSLFVLFFTLKQLCKRWKISREKFPFLVSSMKGKLGEHNFPFVKICHFICIPKILTSHHDGEC